MIKYKEANINLIQKIMHYQIIKAINSLLSDVYSLFGVYYCDFQLK